MFLLEEAKDGWKRMESIDAHIQQKKRANLVIALLCSPRLPNRFSDVSICQDPNENMMRRIYGPGGGMEGWEGGDGWNKG